MPDFAHEVRRRLGSGWRALVPPLWHLEMANGFAIGERRGLLTESQSERCLNDVQGLLASVIDGAAESISLRQALSVARTFRLTAYDAVYLETARKEQVPLATLDRALAQAAAKAGIPALR